MALEVKICGINSPEAARALSGAAMAGFVFFPPSPRCVTAQEAAKLAGMLPPGIQRVGLFVDADDDAIDAVLREISLDCLQFHGSETPARVREAKKLFSTPVMKALKIATAGDVREASAYFDAADRLLFDSRPPEGGPALPGGRGASFEWALLAGFTGPLPWMLAGGLKTENLCQAVRESGARAVDVSSGVEDAPGRKNPAKIREFLALAAGL